MLAGRTAIT